MDKLVVPVNKPVQFVLKSEDVVHSFWVPAWGIKRAVIPSETRTLVVTPDTVTSTKVGPTVRVQCAQICGVGHAFMLADLRVVSASDFKQWIAGQNMYRRWFWLFILAEAMIFVTLFSTRFLLAFASKPSSLNIATTPKLIRRIERSRSRSSAKSISRPLGATQVGY